MTLKMHDKDAEEAEGYGAQLRNYATSFPNQSPCDLLPVVHREFMALQHAG